MARFDLERYLAGLELQSRSLEDVREAVWPICAPLLARLLRAQMEACLLLPLLGRVAQPLSRPPEPRCREIAVWLPSELRDILGEESLREIREMGCSAPSRNRSLTKCLISLQSVRSWVARTLL